MHRAAALPDPDLDAAALMHAGPVDPARQLSTGSLTTRVTLGAGGHFPTFRARTGFASFLDLIDVSAIALLRR